MKGHFPLLSLMVLLFFTHCQREDSLSSEQFFRFTFSDSTGWITGFADYPPTEGTDYELHDAFTTLPVPLDTGEAALLLSGSNRSDDLFMFVKRKVTGLLPGAIYRAEIAASFASDAASEAIGIGGAPGESVYIKAGVTLDEPEVIFDLDGWYRLSTDKGNQSHIGSEALSLGNAANGTDEFSYVLLDRIAEGDLEVSANEQGEIWLYIGSDSGFEGKTTLYYRDVRLRLVPLH